MFAVELPALDGHDPLGFLAALGLFRLTTAEYGPDVRLAYSDTTANAVLHSPARTIEDLVEMLTTIVDRATDGAAIPGIDPRFPLRKSGRGTGEAADPMRVPREQVRGKLVHTISTFDNPDAHTWLAVLITDLATDRQGRATITPYTAPSGQQSLRTFFEKPLQAVQGNPRHLHDALTDWRRTDGFTGEYLDHRVLRSAADHPSGRSTEAGVPGATWLATQAIPLLRLTGNQNIAIATLWHHLNNRSLMIWPLWRRPLDQHAVQALLEHPALRPTLDQYDQPTLVRARLAPLGVFAVHAAERVSIEGRKSAGALAPTPLRLI